MNRGSEALIMPDTKKPHLGPEQCAQFLGECGCKPVLRVNTGGYIKPNLDVLAEMRCPRFPNGHVAHAKLGIPRLGRGTDIVRSATPDVLIRDTRLAVKDACADCPKNPANIPDSVDPETAA